MTDAPTKDKPKSKYTLVEVPDGVIVRRAIGPLLPDEFLDCPVTYKDTWIDVGGESRVGLHCYPEIVKAIAEWFAERVLSSRARKKDIEQATEMIYDALRGRFKPHWERMVKQIAPGEVSALARLMWSSARGDARLLHEPALYTDAFANLRRDLRKYHACRLFAKALDTVDELYPGALLLVAAEWRDSLAPTKATKALNKTLDKLPPAISYKQIKRLAVMHLEQPITSRLHLIFALCVAEHHHWGLHERTVLSANADQVQRAAAEFGYQVNGRSRTNQISAVAQLILDYPQPYGGDLVGLAQRSRDWHNAMVAQRRQYEPSESEYDLADEAELPAPPLGVGMLAALGITCLRTAGDVRDEGSRMRHCVGSYASKAAAGGCYLFHVDHDGQQATVEVSPRGEVLQAYGPGNTKNSACSYGARELEEAFRYEMKVRNETSLPGLRAEDSIGQGS